MADLRLSQAATPACGVAVSRRTCYDRSTAEGNRSPRKRTIKEFYKMKHILSERSHRVKSGCIEWLGPLDRDGYGRCNQNYSGTKMAHRVAYEQYVGPIPAGMTIHHECFNRKCINPKHLSVMSAAENARRKSPEGLAAIAIAASNGTHCRRGHEYTPDNTYVAKTGARMCKACQRRSHQKRAAQRDAVVLRARCAS